MLNSAELYIACRSNDVQTQTQAFQQLWNYLYRVTYHLVRDQPDADDLAQECTQRALIRIHQRLHECRESAAFVVWARRIASNLTIDELRRSSRFTSLTSDDESSSEIDSANEFKVNRVASKSTTVVADNPSTIVMTTMITTELRSLINQAPMSDRSRRVVVGRYFDELLDEELATMENALVGDVIRPSHVQVTRAKNLAKLRSWPLLQHYL